MFFALSSTIRIVLMGPPSGCGRPPPESESAFGATGLRSLQGLHLVLREGEAESRALARLADQRHFTAVQLDEALDERQAEPGALGLAQHVAAGLAELLEHQTLVL